MDEQMVNAFKMIDKLKTLIAAKWDSDTLKTEIENHVKIFLVINAEINEFYKKEISELDEEETSE